MRRVLPAAFIVIGLLPWLFAFAGADAAIFYRVFCHQMEERTLHFDAMPMALCSRCAGIHLGLVLGAVLALWRPAHGWLRSRGRALVMAAIGVNVLDWLVSFWLLSHVSRIAAGALFGAAAAAFMIAALDLRSRVTSPA